MTQATDFPTFMSSEFAGLGDGERPDYERIRATVDSMVPFNNFVGIRITEVGPDHAVAETPVDDQMRNHMGTVHAGVLFLAAEVGCAGAFAGAFAARLPEITLFALRDSRITFLKPANGRIRARATVDGRTVAAVHSGALSGRFDLDGKALLFDDNDVLVAKVYFDYVCQIAERD